MENVSLENRLDDAKFRRKLYIGLNIASFFGFAGLMAVAAFYDLQLSQAIGDMSNLFGTFFEVVGEAPSYLVLPFCAPIFFYNAKNFSDKRFRIFMRVFGLALSWLGYFMWIYAGTKPGRIDAVYGIPGLAMFAVFGGFVGGAFGLWVGSLIKPEIMTRLLKFAVFSLVFMVSALVVMQALKMLWGRMRFRDMLAAEVGAEGQEGTPYKVAPVLQPEPGVYDGALLQGLDWLMAELGRRDMSAVLYLNNTWEWSGGYGTYLIFVLVRFIFFRNGKYEYDLSRFAPKEKAEQAAQENAPAEEQETDGEKQISDGEEKA